MKKNVLLALLAAAGLLSAAAVKADDGQFMVRARAVYVDFDNGQKDGLPASLGGAKVEADSRWIPEVDLSYFVTPNIAAELVLTYPQKVDILVGGAKLGSIKALPPSLLLQYHFTQLGAFKPYVGLGVNYTIFSSRKDIGGIASVEKTSFGAAAQIGADYMLTKNWSLNLDVKYIQMSTDVMVTGTGKVGKVDLNPITAGFGVGYRF
jgi:outer membrane protein